MSARRWFGLLVPAALVGTAQAGVVGKLKSEPATLVSAAPSATPQSAAEKYVLDRLAAGKPVDLAQLCAGAADGPGCRRLGGDFISGLLTGNAVAQTAWPIGGIQIASAVIDGPVDLTGAIVNRRISIRGSHFTGAVLLDDARLDQSLILECDDFDGVLEGRNMHVGGNLSLMASHFAQAAYLVGSQTAGFLTVGAADFEQGLALGNARVGLTFSFASIDPAFCPGHAHGPPVHAVLPHGLSVDAAEIGGNLQLEGVFGHTGGHDAISANSVRIHGRTGLKVTVDGGIDLQDAEIDGSLYMMGSSISGPVRGARFHVGNDVVLSGATFGDRIDLSDATIGRNLNLRGALIRLSAPGRLLVDLEDAHAGHFGDDAESWTSVDHDLAGFIYGALLPADPAAHQATGWRRAWLAADASEARLFDPQPYQQLSSVLSLSGDRTGALAVAYWAREQERQMAWAQGDIAKYLGLSLLWITVGYGIGGHVFLVLIWVTVFAIAGALVLGRSPKARAKGWDWRLQAGLDRLLPIIALSPEFDDFFKDPEEAGLVWWQVLFFSVTAICGWVLGAFLAAALSGLTQGSS